LEGPCPPLCLCSRPRQRTHDVLDNLPKKKSWYATEPDRQTEAYANISKAESANLAPWFGPHLQRNVYLSLLHLEDGSEKGPKIPESVLRAALLRRAVEDIRRLIQIKSAKQACGSLLQRGSVGDDLWQRFQRAEKEMEEELRDVVTEV
jgi:translocation protein SEC66